MLRPGRNANASVIDLDPSPPLALIVDDDQVFRTVVRAYLEHAGFRVEEAEDGPRAVEKFESVGPDIVLLDIIMPGMDGFETCSALRELPSGPRTPIVMMTGVDDHESIERAYEVGATDFINKPLNSFILTHRIQHIVRANRYLIHFDGLTGLPKRDLFLERLEMAIASGRRYEHYVAVLFLALDNFKRFNDTLGHRAGDQILRQVAERLGELRASDYFARNDEDGVVPAVLPEDQPVARFAGDEFMVLLPDIRQEKDIALVARRVNESLSRPFDIGGKEIHVTASIGVSAYPLDGSDPQLLLERAAVAMNHAKQAGRGQYQFYGERLNARTQERLSIESQLRKSLDQGELFLHFQPKVDIQRTEIAGVEALARLPVVDGKQISPADFIPVAEETGLIVSLGDWVFRKACEEYAKMGGHDLPAFDLSINLSASQFCRKHLSEELARILEETGVEPTRVELELTESILLEDTESSIATLTDLKDLGFRIAMDDFGTGYSALSYLKRFPIDVLKIDQSFVRGLPRDMGDCAIVEGIIELSHKLSLEVVAEGVEHRRQLNFLRDRGCDVIQGFFFSRPIPGENVADWVSDWEVESERALIQAVRESLRDGPTDPQQD